MCSIFTIAMHLTSDFLVSTKRMDEFFRLPEVSNSASMQETGLQKGEIMIRDGNYGWYAAESEVEKTKKQLSITQWILAKACIVDIARCMIVTIDSRNEEEQAKGGDSTSYSNTH